MKKKFQTGLEREGERDTDEEEKQRKSDGKKIEDSMSEIEN